MITQGYAFEILLGASLLLSKDTRICAKGRVFARGLVKPVCLLDASRVHGIESESSEFRGYQFLGLRGARDAAFPSYDATRG